MQEEKNNAVIYYSMKYEGDWDAIGRALINHEPYEKVDPKEKAVTIFDPRYPVSLRRLRFPPWVFYYRGELGLLYKKGITIVGSRNLEPYAAHMTKHIVEQVGGKYVIVSGLAKGVDAVAHASAIKCGARTIGVIGCGLDVIYPRENRILYENMEKNQLIITEYPNGTKPLRHHFPWRNRMLAAMGEKTIVTEAALHSGTMNTVNEAINLSREVWCLPYPYGDESGRGCDLLISQGANILYEEEQLETL